MRPHLLAQQAIVRMLFDGEFAARVRAEPAAALPELPPALRAQLAAIDPRALELDWLLRRRTLRTLFDEFKASTTLFLARQKRLAALDDFFRSPPFHDAIRAARPLAFAYADFLGAAAALPSLAIERALAEARRTRPPPADGRIHRAAGVVALETTDGALAALQQAEQYLFEVSLMPAVALCDDAPPLQLDARAAAATPLYLVTVPSPSGHALVTVDEITYALVASLPAPPSPALQPLVDDEIAVRTWKIERIRVGGDGGRSAVDDEVAVEAPLEIRVGGKALTVVMRTPGADDEDEELARGFLYAESLVDSGADIVAITRPAALTGDELGNVVDVTLRPGARVPAGERLFYASSSCGVCGKNAISALRVRAPLVSSSLEVAAATLTALPERLRAAQPLFARTGGVHASGLFGADGTLEVVREDVGRHNALDKLIGWALATDWLPLTDRPPAVSGRVSYEIVQKAIAAGLPLIAAVGAPSTLAIELAEQFAVTLVGFVRDGGMNVYSHGDRVT